MSIRLSHLISLAAISVILLLFVLAFSLANIGAARSLVQAGCVVVLLGAFIGQAVSRGKQQTFWQAFVLAGLYSVCYSERPHPLLSLIDFVQARSLSTVSLDRLQYQDGVFGNRLGMLEVTMPLWIGCFCGIVAVWFRNPAIPFEPMCRGGRFHVSLKQAAAGVAYVAFLLTALKYASHLMAAVACLAAIGCGCMVAIRFAARRGSQAFQLGFFGGSFFYALLAEHVAFQSEHVRLFGLLFYERHEITGVLFTWLRRTADAFIGIGFGTIAGSLYQRRRPEQLDRGSNG